MIFIIELSLILTFSRKVVKKLHKAGVREAREWIESLSVDGTLTEPKKKLNRRIGTGRLFWGSWNQFCQSITMRKNFGCKINAKIRKNKKKRVGDAAQKCHIKLHQRKPVSSSILIALFLSLAQNNFSPLSQQSLCNWTRVDSCLGVIRSRDWKRGRQISLAARGWQIGSLLSSRHDWTNPDVSCNWRRCQTNS